MEESRPLSRIEKAQGFKMRNGKFVKTDRGETKWQEEVGKGQFQLHDPEECGYVKSAIFNILLMKEVPSRETVDGVDRLFFTQEMTIAVRDGNDGLFICPHEKGEKYYLRDISTGNQFTFEVPLNSDGNVVVKKSKPKKIPEDDEEAVRKAVKDCYPYVFTKTTEDATGTLYGKYLKPK
jgi:hypothetical protein